MTDNAMSKSPLVIQSQHTPGPWHQNLDEQHYLGIEADIMIGWFDEGHFYEVAQMSEYDCDRKTALANARLIAAAPCLLDALKLARNYIKQDMEHFGLRIDYLDTKTMDAINFAIAAATGAQITSGDEQQSEAEFVKASFHS